MDISAKTKKHPTPVSVKYDLPATLDEKVKKYGAEIVNNAVEDAMIITVQALMRRLIEKGSDQAAIQAAVTGWQPNVRTMIRQTAFEKATSSLAQLSPEERKQLLAKLTAMGSAPTPAAAAAAK